MYIYKFWYFRSACYATMPILYAMYEIDPFRLDWIDICSVQI